MMSAPTVVDVELTLLLFPPGAKRGRCQTTGDNAALQVVDDAIRAEAAAQGPALPALVQDRRNKVCRRPTARQVRGQHADHALAEP